MNVNIQFLRLRIHLAKLTERPNKYMHLSEPRVLQEYIRPFLLYLQNPNGGQMLFVSNSLIRKKNLFEKLDFPDF